MLFMNENKPLMWVYLLLVRYHIVYNCISSTCTIPWPISARWYLCDELPRVPQVELFTYTAAVVAALAKTAFN